MRGLWSRSGDGCGPIIPTRGRAVVRSRRSERLLVLELAMLDGPRADAAPGAVSGAGFRLLLHRSEKGAKSERAIWA